jgi:hypothetical protein
MGKITGFLEIERHDRDYAPVEERIHHWHEFVLPVWSKYWSEASISSIANLIALITVPVPHRRPG